jgi:HNH endonuclease
MLLLTDFVPLCNRLVHVTHWQRLVTKNVTFNERTSYKEFCIRIKLKFSEEIDDRRKPPAFRIYTLSAGSDNVEHRQLVDDDTKFEKLRDILMDPSAPHPVIYVWNYDDASPSKMPDVAQAKSDTGSAKSDTASAKSDTGSAKSDTASAKSDTASAVSRDPTASKFCKTRDDYTCLCCRYVGSAGFGLKACHLYEIGAHSRIRDEEQRLKILKRLRLVTINDHCNFITLCEKCHPKFDSHRLGIHPTDHTWIVTNEVREDGTTAPSGARFVDIHAKKVLFAETRFIPPTAVLDERMSHFLSKNSPNRYCHICPYVCTSGYELDEHVRVCGATSLPKTFGALDISEST